jgi:hypothetical protein
MKFQKTDKYPLKLALKFGFAKIIDGIVVILTLGHYHTDNSFEVIKEVSRWRKENGKW